MTIEKKARILSDVGMGLTIITVWISVIVGGCMFKEWLYPKKPHYDLAWYGEVHFGIDPFEDYTPPELRDPYMNNPDKNSPPRNDRDQDNRDDHRDNPRDHDA